MELYNQGVKSFEVVGLSGSGPLALGGEFGVFFV